MGYIYLMSVQAYPLFARHHKILQEGYQTKTLNDVYVFLQRYVLMCLGEVIINFSIHSLRVLESKSGFIEPHYYQ